MTLTDNVVSNGPGPERRPNSPEAWRVRPTLVRSALDPPPARTAHAALPHRLDGTGDRSRPGRAGCVAVKSRMGGKLVRYAPRNAAKSASVLLSVLIAVAAVPSAYAQTVSCTAIPAWNASTIYNPGDKLVYQNRLYQANIQIWNAPPTHCPSCGWYQDLGACGSGGSNQPPSVTLTAPANGASYSAGSSIAVTANASDSDGNVTQVEFFRGTASLGVDTSAPFACDAGPTPAPAATASRRWPPTTRAPAPPRPRPASPSPALRRSTPRRRACQPAWPPPRCRRAASP